jgi:ABC-type polysaccharide/polyol phosphate export permease
MVGEVRSLVRASMLGATSYRVSTVLSLFSLATVVVPIYFIADALQPVMATSIEGEGGQFFAFVLLGMIAYQFTSVALYSVPGAIGGGIGSGSLEAMLTTPASLPSLLVGLTGYGFLWTFARAVVLLLTGLALGAHFAWSQLALGLLLLVLIALVHFPIGVITAALVLAFRNQLFVPRAVLTVSLLFGGVYYPSRVLPYGLPDLAEYLPLTHGLRALRRTLLDGAPLRAVMPDVLAVCGFAAVLTVIACVAFGSALRYARRCGTLAHY